MIFYLFIGVGVIPVTKSIILLGISKVPRDAGLRYMIMFKKLLFLLVVVISLVFLLTEQGFCQNCSSEGEPCSEDEKLGKCCLTYTNTEGKTRKLKCSTEPETENTCVDDGPVE